MPYWYYAGKTTTCIDLPDPDDRTKTIPVIITPRLRFHAPRASIQHLLKTKPPQIKLLPDPPAPKPAKVAAPAPAPAKAPAPAPAPAPVPEPIAEVPKGLTDAETATSPEATEVEGDESDANSTEGVVASPSSDTEAEAAEEVPMSEGESSEPEKKKKTSRKRRLR